MKVSTRLFLLSTFSLVIALIVWVGLRWSEQHVFSHMAHTRHAERIQLLVFGLQTRLRNYNAYNDADSLEAWRQTQGLLQAELQASPSLPSVQAVLLHSIKMLNQGVDRLFAHLQTVISTPPATPQLAAQVRARLSERIYAELENMNEDSYRFIQLSHAEMEHAVKQGRIIAFTVLAAMSLAFTLVAILIAIGIRAQIERLRQGVRRVAAGDLSYQMRDGARDELGELSRSFDHMIQRLRETSVSRDELRLLVEKGTAELSTANRNFRRSNEELQQFAHVASHDLQEPLRVLVSFADLLQKRYADQLGEDGREFIGYISDSAKRMRRMIQDLLDYARVETRDREPEAIDLNRITQQALANLRYALSGVRVEVADLPMVSGDANQLLSLMQNLIGNAAKYRRDEPALIEISAQTQDDEVTVAIKDNGIGIDEKHLERIFLVFQRLHTREEYEGTGIGLSICKKIVERHGGQIWLQSRLGEGSTFYFTLIAATALAKP